MANDGKSAHRHVHERMESDGPEVLPESHRLSRKRVAYDNVEEVELSSDGDRDLRAPRRRALSPRPQATQPGPVPWSENESELEPAQSAQPVTVGEFRDLKRRLAFMMKRLGQAEREISAHQSSLEHIVADLGVLRDRVNACHATTDKMVRRAVFDFGSRSSCVRAARNRQMLLRMASAYRKVQCQSPAPRVSAPQLLWDVGCKSPEGANSLALCALLLPVILAISSHAHCACISSLWMSEESMLQSKIAPNSTVRYVIPNSMNQRPLEPRKKRQFAQTVQLHLVWWSHLYPGPRYTTSQGWCRNTRVWPSRERCGPLSREGNFYGFNFRSTI